MPWHGSILEVCSHEHFDSGDYHLQLLCGLAVILVVLLQSGKSAGLSGSIGGVADSFLARNKAKTMDAKLARATKWIGAVFLILTLILLILQGRAA